MAAISVCLCTFNRADELKKSLTTLQKYASTFEAEDELLIVDNNSTDNTKEIVEQFKKTLPIKYYFEPKQGLSVARNKGLSEFENEVLIFIDDDISISKNFLSEYRKGIAKHTGYDFFGGKIEVDWQSIDNKWLKSNDLALINGMLGHYDLGGSNCRYEKNSLLPYGANFAITRKLIKRIGMFNEGLGVKGKEIGRGEETDYFIKAREQNFYGMYLSQVNVFHRIQTEKVTLPYIFRYGIQKGIAKLNRKSDVNRLGALVRIFTFSLKGLFQLMKFRKDRFYQCVINIGMQYAILRFSYAK